MPASSIATAESSLISSPSGTIISPETGSSISNKATLPKILSYRFTTISSLFLSAPTVSPLRVPQSGWLITTS